MAANPASIERGPDRRWLTAAVAVVCGALFFLLPGYIALGAVVGMVGGLLLLARPRTAFYLLVLSVPIQDQLDVAGLTITQLAFVGTLGSWLLWRLLNRQQVTLGGGVLPFFFVFFVAQIISVFTAYSVPMSLAELSRWAVTILAYVLAINLIRTRAQMNILVACLVAGGTAEALLGTGQSFLRSGPLSFLVNDAIFRAYGTIGAPNSYAGYINHSLPLALAFGLYWVGVWWTRQRATMNAESDYKLRPPAWWQAQQAGLRRSFWLMLVLVAASGVLAFALILSLSRGAWVGLSFGLLAMVIALGRKGAGPLIGLGLAVLIFVGALSAGALPTELADRVTSITENVRIFDPTGLRPNPENFAIIERMTQWYAAWGMFEHSPWTGVGIGNYNIAYDYFHVIGWPQSRGHAHNYYLHILAECGIVGLFSYALLLIAILWQAVRAIRATRDNGYLQAVSIGALGVIVTFMGHQIFENLHVLNMGTHWSSVVALFYLVRVLPATDKEDETADRNSDGWGFARKELAKTESG